MVAGQGAIFIVRCAPTGGMVVATSKVPLTDNALPLAFREICDIGLKREALLYACPCCAKKNYQGVP